MPQALSSTAIASQNAETTGEVWLILVTLEHDTLAEPIRVCNNNENVPSRGHLFIAWEDLGIQLPGDDPDSPSSARLAIGNIDPVIVRSLREIDSPPRVTLEIILASAPDFVEMEFAGLVLRDANYDPTRIEGELAFEEILTEPVAETMTPDKFPGLF